MMLYGAISEEEAELFDIYRSHSGKVSDKWSLYIIIYNQIFHRLRERPVRILEIGVQNGGSLEIWSKYFPNAQCVVGVDIDEKCRRLAFGSDRIKVIVGDATDPKILTQITEFNSKFDIIIDDGSHLSSDIVRTFCSLFPILDDQGIYVVEDLHCSYYSDYEGGVHAPFSSMAFLKRLADLANIEHWGAPVPENSILKYHLDTWASDVDCDSLRGIREVSFFNSLCVIHKDPSALEGLGRRVVSGSAAIIDSTAPERHGMFQEHRNECASAWGPNSVSTEQRAHEWIEVEQLRLDLTDSRSRPLRELKRLLIFRTLMATAGFWGYLSPNITARLHSAMIRRDPRRAIPSQKTDTGAR